MPMDASQLNPFIRYMDLRCGSISYSEPIKAYDYRLFAIREGECAAETETKRLTLRAGSCLIIPPDHAYRMLFHRDAPAMLYNINFSLSYLPGNGQAFRPDPPARFRPERMPEVPDPAFFPIPTLFQDVPQIQQTAALLLSEREKRDVYFNELCSALLKGMLLQLLREPKAGEKPVPTVVERRHTPASASPPIALAACSATTRFISIAFFTSMRTRPFIFTRCSAASAMPACCWLRPI